MSGVEDALGQLCLDLSRAVLKAPQLAVLHEDDRALCTFLSEHFAALAARKRQEAPICIRQAHVTEVIERVVVPAMTGTEPYAVPVTAGSVSLDGAEESLLKPALAWSARGPFIAQRQLTQSLAAASVPTGGVAEVLELCRVVTERGGCGRVPIGQVNIIHFAAIFVTLWPVANVVELIAEVVDAVTAAPWGTPAQRTGLLLQFCAVWACLDTSLAHDYAALAVVLAQYPGASWALLLDAFPHLESFCPVALAARARAADATGGGSVSEFASQVAARYGGAARAIASGPVVAVHSADAVPVAPLATAAGAGGGDSATDSDDQGETQGETEDAERDAFWSALVAPPGAV